MQQRASERNNNGLTPQEELAYHYLGLEEDQQRIIYNKKDAERYVNDWISGVATAEEFVLRAMNEDFTEFMAIVDSRPSVYDLGVLLDLVLRKKQLDENYAAINFKKRLTKCSNREFAEILEDSFNLGILAEVIGNEKSAYAIKIREAKILPHIRNPEALKAICLLLGKEWCEAVSKALYQDALLGSSLEQSLHLLQTIKNCFNSLPLQAARQKVQVGTRIEVKLEAAISLDYYLASLRKEVNTLLDLAFQGNPQLFNKLLQQEFEFIRTAQGGSTRTQQRKDFYCSLMQHVDMRAFFDYEKRLAEVNALFAQARLAPIEGLKTQKHDHKDTTLFSLDNEEGNNRKEEDLDFLQEETPLPQFTPAADPKKPGALAGMMSSFSSVFSRNKKGGPEDGHDDKAASSQPGNTKR